MKTYNIFLAEDDEGDKKLITSYFNMSPYNIKIEVVDDGEKAVHHLFTSNNNKPDLILLDLNLPRISGHKLLQKIKENSELKNIPVIILTTSNSNTDILKSYNSFASGYFVKPFELLDWQRIILQIADYWFGTVKLPHME